METSSSRRGCWLLKPCSRLVRNQDPCARQHYQQALRSWQHTDLTQPGCVDRQVLAGGGQGGGLLTSWDSLYLKNDGAQPV